MSEPPSASAAASGRDVLDALARQPGGPQLLELAEARDDVAVVGGAVRDLLLGRTPHELDVVVGEDAVAFARELAEILGASVTEHERFATASVEWEAGRVDVAQRRSESYSSAGALPDVRPGSTAEDLARRDFTINAIAVPIGGARKGAIDSAAHALDDLAARRLRVLHERSFYDDPTRLLRLGRYRARLRCELEGHTAELAAQALSGGAIDTVSRARIGAELRLALTETDAVAALHSLGSLGVLGAIDVELTFDPDVAAAALALAPQDARADLLLMAVLLRGMVAERGEQASARVHELLDALEFTAGERERVSAAALRAATLSAALSAGGRPSRLHRALAQQTPEAIALAGAIAAASDDRDVAQANAREWLGRLRHTRLEITGDDLLAAGVPSGPQVGARLAAALERKLDGEIDDGPDAELNAALAADV